MNSHDPGKILGSLFGDFKSVEKLADLGREVRLRGVPDTNAPEAGEIGYYAPTRGLVLFYGSTGRWPGPVRMGHFSYGLDALRHIHDGTSIRISPVKDSGK